MPSQFTPEEGIEADIGNPFAPPPKTPKELKQEIAREREELTEGCSNNEMRIPNFEFFKKFAKGKEVREISTATTAGLNFVISPGSKAETVKEIELTVRLLTADLELLDRENRNIVGTVIPDGENRKIRHILKFIFSLKDGGPEKPKEEDPHYDKKYEEAFLKYSNKHAPYLHCTMKEIQNEIASLIERWRRLDRDLKRNLTRTLPGSKMALLEEKLKELEACKSFVLGEIKEGIKFLGGKIEILQDRIEIVIDNIALLTRKINHNRSGDEKSKINETLELEKLNKELKNLTTDLQKLNKGASDLREYLKYAAYARYDQFTLKEIQSKLSRPDSVTKGELKSLLEYRDLVIGEIEKSLESLQTKRSHPDLAEEIISEIDKEIKKMGEFLQFVEPKNLNDFNVLCDDDRFRIAREMR